MCGPECGACVGTVGIVPREFVKFLTEKRERRDEGNE